MFDCLHVVKKQTPALKEKSTSILSTRMLLQNYVSGGLITSETRHWITGACVQFIDTHFRITFIGQVCVNI